ATAEDIDLGMRYGTNYPRGPFEWCRRIGAPRIVRALDAWAALDPAQDAYKAAEGLRQEALSQQNKLL
ncbi:MAG: 3-hydroxyacyl-CoA dehydrogenase family protein, partial [Bacteroidota bacterium]